MLKQWWCFCFQGHHRTSERLSSECKILRCKIVVCIYSFDLLRSQPIILLSSLHTSRTQFTPIMNTCRWAAPINPKMSNHPCTNKGLRRPCTGQVFMVEVMGTAPMSQSCVESYQRIMSYLYHKVFKKSSQKYEQVQTFY